MTRRSLFQRGGQWILGVFGASVLARTAIVGAAITPQKAVRYFPTFWEAIKQRRSEAFDEMADCVWVIGTPADPLSVCWSNNSDTWVPVGDVCIGDAVYVKEKRDG